MVSVSRPEARDGALGDAEACRAQLRRILASPEFDATERDRRFLGYVVEEALAGRAERIKAYSIAIEVFGRDASFDPQTDPIVRVEAGHLRRALDRYYLSAGRDDPVIITVPKGGYAPSFEPRPPGGPAAPAAPASRRRGRLAGVAVPLALAMALGFALGIGTGALVPRGGAGARPAADIPRLVVEPFAALDRTPTGATVAAGLTSEVIAGVARFKDLVVVASPSGAGAPPRYRLGGGVVIDGQALRVQARLQRQSDGAVIWADSFTADLATERPLAVEARVAGEIATAIGQPYGAIFQADAAERLARPPAAGDAYACTLAYFGFRATLDAPSYAEARACLDEAVRRHPDYATAWGLLAEVRIDGRRFGFAPDESIETALAEARHALVLDPLNVRALQAKMLALYLSGDLEGGVRVGAMAFAINPNDTELMSEYGYRLALSGRWDEGCRLMAEAHGRNPGPLAYYETGLALCAWIAGDYEDAVTWIRTAAVPGVPAYHMIAAAVLAEAGRLEEARAERDWLMTNAPEFVRDLRRTVGARVGRPEDFARFLASLAKAGLVVPD